MKSEGASRALTTDDIDMIADKAARKALNLVYAEVGKSLLTKLFWLTGVVVVALAMWLSPGSIDGG